jgi:hypothetical protein
MIAMVLKYMIRIEFLSYTLTLEKDILSWVMKTVIPFNFLTFPTKFIHLSNGIAITRTKPLVLNSQYYTTSS